ncbi:MAG: hypothetical protein ACKV2O_00375 [Acidimicrobiales bacterium]
MSAAGVAVDPDGRRAGGRDGTAVRPSLQLVRDGRRLRPGPLGTVVISVVFITLFVLAFLQAVLVQGQLGLDTLDRRIADLEVQRARMQVDVATAESPLRIQAAAAENGLVRPPEVVFLARADVEAYTNNGSGSVSLSLDPAGGANGTAPDAGAARAAVTPPVPAADATGQR